MASHEAHYRKQTISFFRPDFDVAEKGIIIKSFYSWKEGKERVNPIIPRVSLKRIIVIQIWF